MATGSGVGNRVRPASSRAAPASASSRRRASSAFWGCSGNRAASRSPTRKIALTVPDAARLRTGRRRHWGNCSSTSVRTISAGTLSWLACICIPGSLAGKAPGRQPDLAGELGGAGFADDGDADLARIGELLLHLLGDVARDHLSLDVVDLVGLDHDPDLAARLHGEDLLDALPLGRDLLEALQPLDVHLKRLAPGAGPAAADRVRGLGEHGLDGAHLHLVVMGLDRVHHVVGLAVFAGDLRADQRVAALDLVGE